MSDPNVFPVQVIWDELARICDADLKSVLNLQSVIQGDLTSQPSPGILKLVNGIWIHPSPALSIQDTELPRIMIQTLNFRLVYLRKMAVGENVTKMTAADAITIANHMTAKYNVPDITNLPTNAQILWMRVKTIEFEPQEDDLVSQIAADIRAMAIQLEVFVRVNARG